VGIGRLRAHTGAAAHDARRTACRADAGPARPRRGWRYRRRRRASHARACARHGARRRLGDPDHWKRQAGGGRQAARREALSARVQLRGARRRGGEARLRDRAREGLRRGRRYEAGAARPRRAPARTATPTAARARAERQPPRRAGDALVRAQDRGAPRFGARAHRLVRRVAVGGGGGALRAQGRQPAARAAGDGRAAPRLHRRAIGRVARRAVALAPVHR